MTSLQRLSRAPLFAGMMVSMALPWATAHAIVVADTNTDLLGRDSQTFALAMGNNNIHRSTGMITNDLGNGLTGVGSGVVIDDEWVLTAAHVVDGGATASQLDYYIHNLNYQLDVDQIFLHPNWTGTLAEGNDLALLKLSGSVSQTVPFQVDPAVRYRGSNETAMLSNLVGFGIGGFGSEGADPVEYPPGQVKRAAHNRVDYITQGGYMLEADFDSGLAGDNVFGSASQTRLEGSAAQGDSGGGLYFADLDNNRALRLAGIASYGRAAADPTFNSDYGDVMGYTRVSLHNAWIDAVLAGDPNASSFATPVGPVDPVFLGQTLSTLEGTLVPEPVLASALAVGGLALLRRRDHVAAR